MAESDRLRPSTDDKSQNPVDAFLSQSTPSDVLARYRSLANAAEEADFGELDRDVVVIDTETTGVSFKNDELTQIAAARMSQGKIVEWFVTFVNPGKPIPEDIQRLTGIGPQDVAEAPTPREALAQLTAFVGGSDLVAHNAAFDRHFCTKHPEGRQLRENAWIDSLDLARVALPRLSSHRLIDLVHAFGAPESTHRADDDVVATCQVYRVLLAAVAAMPADLVHTIAELQPADEWPAAKVFQYFDQQNQEQAGGAVAPLSLRELRARRTKETSAPDKLDAADVAMGKVPLSPDSPEALAALAFPTAEEVEQAFEPDGLVGGCYSGYECRKEQLAMSKAVNQAFSTSTNLVVEAGTGVGKSMAYLVPAVMAAKRSGIGVGVATKTNNLLDQLVNKELPLLDQAFAEQGGVRFSPLKGFSHYPCLLAVDRTLRAGAEQVEVGGHFLPQAPALAALLSFIEQSDYDDIDTLKIDYRRIPRWRISTSSHECLRRKCPFYGSACFVHGARAKAAAADVVVTNHSMLFCDLEAEGGLLPPIRYWVMDEAHGAEAEGRRAFSIKLASADLLRIAQRVASEESGRNVFKQAERRLGGEAATTLYALCAKAKSAGSAFNQAVERFVPQVKDLLYYEPAGGNKGYERIELWINDEIRRGSRFQVLVESGRVLGKAIEALITASQELVAYLEGLEGAARIQREIASISLQLRECLAACETILFAPTPVHAYSAELVRTAGNYTDVLQAQLISVADRLNETLFANTHSVVFTSATLSIDGSFDALSQALGLNAGEQSESRFLQLDSSYDFDRNMTIYVPTDMPDPTEPSYLSKLQKLLVAIHRAQGGSVLTLFTNRREMESCYKVVSTALAEDKLHLICQRKGTSVKNLRDEFVRDEQVSLMALKSFWEGFDAPGNTLKTVVIPRLPFRKPSDPLSCERQLNDPRAWAHYVLPDAIIETRQAAGRLIRSADDRGNLVLADHRLLSKGYGKKFLASMPSKKVRELSIAQIARELVEGREPASEDGPRDW